MSVAPLAGAWIEINFYQVFTILSRVAPLAGAWIEIRLWKVLLCKRVESLPSRERGLKYYDTLPINHRIKSLPSRERGLK